MGCLYMFLAVFVLFVADKYVFEIIAILSVGFIINGLEDLARSIRKRSTVQNNRIEEKEDK